MAATCSLWTFVSISNSFPSLIFFPLCHILDGPIIVDPECIKTKLCSLPFKPQAFFIVFSCSLAVYFLYIGFCFVLFIYPMLFLLCFMAYPYQVMSINSYKMSSWFNFPYSVFLLPPYAIVLSCHVFVLLHFCTGLYRLPVNHCSVVSWKTETVSLS